MIEFTAADRELFRELLLPRAKRYHDFIKYKCPHLKIFYHTCGAVYTLLGDLIESGIQEEPTELDEPCLAEIAPPIVIVVPPLVGTHQRRHVPIAPP